MAAIVMTKPTPCVTESASSSGSQPITAPVIGAARPSRGGAKVGRRRMPLNDASAVPIALR